LFLLLAFTFSSCRSNFSDQDILSQVSTIDALLDGVYDGTVTCGELKEFGDFGIGTFDALDGEMVFLDGEDYRQLSPRELRRKVGMIMQMPYLFPGTVAENIRFGPQQRGKDLPDAEIERLLARVGLSGFSERDVGRLSGGEAQRVALARALANAPEALLLDEPTSALDDEAKAAVERLLAEVIREEGLTCVWVTHDLAQAARMGDRVAMMEEGRLLRIGSPEEVLNA